MPTLPLPPLVCIPLLVSLIILLIDYFLIIAPYVTSANAIPTSGGTITIEGDNFGINLSSSSSVKIGQLDCQSPTISIPHTTITCNVGEGEQAARQHISLILNNNPNTDSNSAFSRNGTLLKLQIKHNSLTSLQPLILVQSHQTVK